jgi:hypothetical protein
MVVADKKYPGAGLSFPLQQPPNVRDDLSGAVPTVEVMAGSRNPFSIPTTSKALTMV